MNKLMQNFPNMNKFELSKEYKTSCLQKENEEVDEFDEESQIYFEFPVQLVETIDKIEADNLQFIQIIQENEQALLEIQQKSAFEGEEKTFKISELSRKKVELLNNIRCCEEEISQMQKKTQQFEKEEFRNKLEKIKVLVFGIYQNCRSDFDKSFTIESLKDLEDKKGLMFCLAQMESLIYKFSLAIKKENHAMIYKHVVLKEDLFRQ